MPRKRDGVGKREKQERGIKKRGERESKPASLPLCAVDTQCIDRYVVL